MPAGKMAEMMASSSFSERIFFSISTVSCPMPTSIVAVWTTILITILASTGTAVDKSRQVVGATWGTYIGDYWF